MTSSYRKKKDIFLFGNSNGPLFFQGPKGYCHKIIENTSKSIWISYHFNKENNLYDYFENLISDIEQKYEIKVENPYRDYGINLFLQQSKGNVSIDLFNIGKERIHISDFPDKSYIIPYMWINKITKVNESWQFCIYMTQCMIFPISYRCQTCMIEYAEYTKEIVIDSVQKQKQIETDKKDEQIITFLEHPVYGKYFKMLKMGIPREAIRVKMRTEINEDLMDNEPSDVLRIKKISQEEYYGKYFKMLKMGIPRIAVEQKMSMEGLESVENILDNPQIMVLDLPHKKEGVDLLGEIGKRKLSKNKEHKPIIKINNKSEIKPTQKINRGLAGISLADILNKKNAIFLKTN